MYDLIITNGNLWKEGKKEIALKSGRIVEIASRIEHPATDRLDAGGRTIFPGFVDLHTHPDKAMSFSMVENASGTLLEAIGNMNRYFETASSQEIAQRASKMMEMALNRGTTAIRCHITLEECTGMRTWEAALEVREAFSSRLDLKLIAFPGAIKRLEVGGAAWKRLEEAISRGADAVGGCPTLSEDHVPFTETLFDLAEKHNLPLDLHVDESEAPQADALEYLAETTLRRGMKGRVTAGHCTSLSAMEPERADQVLAKVAEAKIHMVTLPSCNLYLMGRGDRKNRRRGTTRIQEILEKGINLSLASDNIRDPFRPFGNANLLEEALLTAQVAQMGKPEDFQTLLEMITYNPAKAMGLTQYGLSTGSQANLAIIDAPDPVSALIGQGQCWANFYKGTLVGGTSL